MQLSIGEKYACRSIAHNGTISFVKVCTMHRGGVGFHTHSHAIGDKWKTVSIE